MREIFNPNGTPYRPVENEVIGAEKDRVIEKIKTYEQQIGCGSASLLIVYRALGIKTTEGQIASNLEVNIRGGCDWGQMIRQVKRDGLRVAFFEGANYEMLEQAYRFDLPTIVGWIFDREKHCETWPHFSVIRAVKNSLVMLADPAFGNLVTYKYPDFKKKWHDEEVIRGMMVIGR